MLNDFDEVNDLDQLNSRYEVLRRLGEDGGCAVYAVRGRESDRHYVVKVMPKPGAGSAGAGTLHLWQAHTMERLEHPRLLVLHAVHHLQGGTLALALERRRGRTLAERIEAEGPLPIATVEATLREVAEALAYLHGRGVIHRGVGLDSVLLDRDSGCARLAHFGIPRGGRGAGGALEPAGREARSPVSDPDARDDLYQLGLVGYAMLTGEAPPTMGTDLPIPGAADAPGPLEALRSDAPPHLCRAIERCLHPDPRRRWRNAEELLAGLDPASAHLPVETAANPVEALGRLARAGAGVVTEGAKRVRPRGLALALPVALVILVAWATLRPEGDRQEEASTGRAPAPAVSRLPAADTARLNELEWRAHAAEPEPQPRPGSASSSPATPPTAGGGGGGSVVAGSPRGGRPPASRPARRAPLPALLGEELASAD